MKKVLISFMFLLLFVFVLSGASYCFQGRMGGMGDPYGLVEDEADFLIHPSKIARGEGIRFYGNYRFTYTGVTNWDISFDRYNPAGVLQQSISDDITGDELRHNALLGAAFPLGQGRMGLFFTYNGIRDEYEGDTTTTMDSEFTSDLDAFALRLLYGVPIGGFTLGGELGIAYRHEKNTLIYLTPAGILFSENIISGEIALVTPPWIPYDSQYWEVPFKVGVAGTVGPLDVGCTLQGGVIASGDNTVAQRILMTRADLDGDVGGWRIGGDLWMRYPLADRLALPLLVRLGYQTKTRDGDGTEYFLGGPTGRSYDYESNEKGFKLEVGGGLDKEFSKGSRIAAGIYYGYLRDSADYTLETYTTGIFSSSLDCSDYPAITEHQVIVRLAGEREFSPTVALRMGVNVFYGWATGNLTLKYANAGPPLSAGQLDLPLDGYHWGIGGSLGGTIRLRPITLEPFVNVGYQSLDLSGDGSEIMDGLINGLYNRDDIRSEWNIGGGLSILFDL